MLKTAPLQIRAYEHLREMIEENQLEDGVIYRENLKKAKLDLNEFLTYCRIGGWQRRSAYRAPPCGTRCKSWNRRG